jgi:hypothetical protein
VGLVWEARITQQNAAVVLAWERPEATGRDVDRGVVRNVLKR